MRRKKRKEEADSRKKGYDGKSFTFSRCTSSRSSGLEAEEEQEEN
jgi:hypothetical protein